jgi:hypothetical protein
MDGRTDGRTDSTSYSGFHCTLTVSSDLAAVSPSFVVPNIRCISLRRMLLQANYSYLDLPVLSLIDASLMHSSDVKVYILHEICSRPS